MACGRRKNLEIAARNLLCSHGDRRRNFPTTRDGNRRRGSPEPPGKGQLRAFGQGEVRRHRQGGNSELPVRGKPRTTRYWADFGASGLGESPVPTRQEGNPQGGTSGHRRRKTSKYAAEGKPRAVCGEESSGPSAKGKLQSMRRRGNPELRNEKKTLSHPAKGKLEPFGFGGNPGQLVKESPEPLAEEILGATWLGGNPGLVGKEGNPQAHGAGKPRATR